MTFDEFVLKTVHSCIDNLTHLEDTIWDLLEEERPEIYHGLQVNRFGSDPAERIAALYGDIRGSWDRVLTYSPGGGRVRP